MKLPPRSPQIGGTPNSANADSITLEPENGFYHCGNCGFQSQDIVHAVADEDDLHATGGVSSLYNERFHRKSQPLLIQPITKVEPSEPQDFPISIPVIPGDLASGIRVRYVGGLQLVLQRQCAALVESFEVSPIITGLVGTLWLRFVVASRVFDERGPERAVTEAEAAFVATPVRPERHHPRIEVQFGGGGY